MASNDDVRDYFYGLIGKRIGDPADDYKSVLQQLVNEGMEVNYEPEEQAKHNPEMAFRGLKIVKDASGSIRGTVQAPSHERDPNGFYTHEFLVIRDRVQGQPPFVGPFDWAWDDRGGGRVYLNDDSPDAGNGDGGDGGDGGEEPTGDGVTAAQVAAMIATALEPVHAQLAEAVKFGDSLALEAANGMILCAEGGGPERTHQEFWLRSRTTIADWESWKVRRGV